MSTALQEQNQEDDKLSTQLSRRQIEAHQWNALKRSLFPDASNDSVLMYIDYCKARGLDIMKRPAHIVPMKYKDGDDWKWRDVVLPGIYEYRMTAHGTGEYLGHSEPEYGDPVTEYGVKAPEWCAMTMYRWNAKAERQVEFPVKVYFREVCATYYDREANEHVANARWKKAPVQMLTKCCEAAGLREAFPSEIGSEPTYEEMQGHNAPVEVNQAPQRTESALKDRLTATSNEPEPQAPQEPLEPATDEPEPPQDDGAPTLEDVLADVKKAKTTEDLAAAIASSEHLAEDEIEKVRAEYQKKVKALNRKKNDD